MRGTRWAWVWAAWSGLAPQALAQDEATQLESAIPRLLAEGRDAEALARVRAAAAAAPDPALGLLARAWLARALTQPPRVVSAAIGMAQAGDGSVGGILEAALLRG